jgi:hypothetical protein
MTPEEEFNEVLDWAWTKGIEAIDAKDKQYAEASVHLEMFLVLGEILGMCGWTRDELLSILDEHVFDDMVVTEVRLH